MSNFLEQIQNVICLSIPTQVLCCTLRPARWRGVLNR